MGRPMKEKVNNNDLISVFCICGDELYEITGLF